VALRAVDTEFLCFLFYLEYSICNLLHTFTLAKCYLEVLIGESNPHNLISQRTATKVCRLQSYGDQTGFCVQVSACMSIWDATHNIIAHNISVVPLFMVTLCIQW